MNGQDNKDNLLQELEDMLNDEPSDDLVADISVGEGVVRKEIAKKALLKILNNNKEKFSKHYLLLTRFDFEKLIVNTPSKFDQDDIEFVSEYLVEVGKLLESSNINIVDLSILEELVVLANNEIAIEKQIKSQYKSDGSEFEKNYLRKVLVLQNVQTYIDGNYSKNNEYDFCLNILTSLPKKGVNVKVHRPFYFGDVDNFITSHEPARRSDAVGVAAEIISIFEDKGEKKIMKDENNTKPINKNDDDDFMDFGEIDEKMGVTNNAIVEYKKKTTMIERVGRSAVMSMFGPLYGVNYIVENFTKNKYDVFGQVFSGKGKTKAFGDSFSFKEPDTNVIFNFTPILATSVSYFLRDKNPKIANILDSTPIIFPIIQNLMSGRNPLDYGYSEESKMDFIQLGLTALPLVSGIFIKPLFDPNNENGVSKLMAEASSMLTSNSQRTRIPGSFK